MYPGPKLISQLKIGDQVLAVDKATGAAVYDTVYLTPHRDGSSFTSYVNLHISRADSQVKEILKLSAWHYIPTACGKESGSQCLKHAGDVQIGDKVWLVPAAGDHKSSHIIDSTAMTVVLGTVDKVSLLFMHSDYICSWHTAVQLECQID
jgi:hypothetical protein